MTENAIAATAKVAAIATVTVGGDARFDFLAARRLPDRA
jgi:hypothetical protein